MKLRSVNVQVPLIQQFKFSISEAYTPHSQRIGNRQKTERSEEKLLLGFVTWVSTQKVNSQRRHSQGRIRKEPNPNQDTADPNQEMMYFAYSPLHRHTTIPPHLQHHTQNPSASANLHRPTRFHLLQHRLNLRIRCLKDAYYRYSFNSISN